MLQAGIMLSEDTENSPFEDYSIYIYRQTAPEFSDRVKDLEKKLAHPVRPCHSCVKPVCYEVLCCALFLAKRFFLTLNNNAKQSQI